MRRYAFQGLWRHKDFLRLWVGETISAFGSQITTFALPLTAVLTLNASATQMGWLSFSGFVPMLIFSLFAGVIVDRLPRKPILILADLGQVLILGIIPVMAWLRILQIPYLYGIAFVSGILTVFFEIAYQAYLPSLVAQKFTLDGNSKLETSYAFARIAGPGFAGWIVQIITAPFALLIDAVSFLISALFLFSIRQPESKAEEQTSKTRPAIWKEISSGLQLVLRHRVLRSIAACNSTINLFGNAVASIVVLYVVRDLKVSPALFGIIMAMGSVGALLGSLFAKPLVKQCGIGSTLIGSTLFFGMAALFLPLAALSPVLAVPFLMLTWFIQGFMLVVFNITQVSFRQMITPEHLQGRMNASMRFLICSALPLGSLLGGLLAGSIGLRPTILLASLGMLPAFLWIVFSPVRRLATFSSVAEDQQPVPF